MFQLKVQSLIVLLALEILHTTTQIGHYGYRSSLTVTSSTTSDEAYFVEYPDGTAHLSGHLTSTQNANAGWEIDVWFMNGMDWDSWSTQAFPTSYKDDYNLVGDNYLDWMYYIVNTVNQLL